MFLWLGTKQSKSRDEIGKVDGKCLLATCGLYKLCIKTCGLHNRGHGVIVEGLQVCYSFRGSAACIGYTGVPIVGTKCRQTRCLIGLRL